MSTRPEWLTDPETKADLTAAVQARRELGPDMEDQLVESFLARIESRVQAQVAQQVGSAKPAKSKKQNPAETIGASFGIAVPLTVIAGIFGGGPAIVAVMVVVFLVNLLYVIESRI